MAPHSSIPIHFDVAIHEIVREKWGSLLSILIGILHDIELAEDALQDAVESAVVHWRKDGLPKNSNAWLLKVAKRKAIDRIRRNESFHNKKSDYKFLLEMDIGDDLSEDQYVVPDERLRLIFTCCHPALDHKTSVALTLQLLGGLTTAEIARAFLVKVETMSQRLVRGKRKIKQAKIPYVVPDKENFKERLDAVLAVVYLIFNEGYSASSGTYHIREELSAEAIRLARILLSLCPDEAEVTALLALMLLHDSRRKARFNNEGDFVSLEEQDRTLWNMKQLSEGLHLTQSALKQGKGGVYQIQAAISALHSEAKSYKETDWSEIVLLYDVLYTYQPTPIVKLNRLAAYSNFNLTDDVIDQLNELENEFKEYQPFYAVKADFLHRLNKYEQAKKYYLKAINLSGNVKEKEFLERRLSLISE